MAHVTLSRPSFGTVQAAAPSRLVTEARVMHKAVKKMTRNRPKKVSRMSETALQPQVDLLPVLRDEVFDFLFGTAAAQPLGQKTCSH